MRKLMLMLLVIACGVTLYAVAIGSAGAQTTAGPCPPGTADEDYCVSSCDFVARPGVPGDERNEGNGNDHIVTGSGDDKIDAGGGNDFVSSDGGADTVRGR